MPNPRLYHVLLLNDDETPMEFVVRVLERLFDMDYDDACAHMLRIHNEGKAICGIYGLEDAKKKVADILALAREHKHPLQSAIEEAD